MRGPLALWRARRNERLCARAADRIQELVDGEVLDDRERRRLERHVDECIPCGVEVESVEELKAALARVGREPDPAVKQRLVVLLEEIRAGEVDTTE